MIKLYYNCRSYFTRLLLLVGIVLGGVSTIMAQTYVNGNAGTSATNNNGVAAPAGTRWHELQNEAGNTTESNASLGVAHVSLGANNLTLADDFTVPAGETWTIFKLKIYALDQVTTSTISPYSNIRVRIYNGVPGAGGTVIFGDMTTNRFNSTGYANLRAIFNSRVPTPTAPTPNFPIFYIEANINTALTAGTYWVEWQVVNTAATFSLTSQTVGIRALPGFNARQSNAGTWAALVDGGSPATAADVAIDLPFSLTYATGPCAGTPTPGNTISSAMAVCGGIPFNLTLQNLTLGTGITYQWQSSLLAAGPWVDIVGATNDNYGTSLSTATRYYRAVVSCGGNSGTSTPVQVTLNPLSACYCIPPATDCTDGDEILNVKLGTLNNSSSGCSGAGYTDYTSLAAATNVIIGVANPMTVTIGPGGNDNVGVWIDYNVSGTYEASEFTLLGSAPSGPITGNINVPGTVAPGTYRMRVRVKYDIPVLNGTQACAAYRYGETEDYLITVSPCVISTVTTQPPATRTISCSGTGTITTTIVGSLNQYQWQVLATGAGAVWTDLSNNATYSGVTTNILTITSAFPIINGYQYRVRYVGACTSPSVTSVTTLTVGPLAPTVSNTLPINRCSTDAPTAITIATPVGLASLATTASGTLHTNIPDDNDQDLGENDHFISNNINVTNIPAGATITGFNVKLNITHSWVGDLILVLKAPNGKIINLAYALTGTGGAAASTGFTNTIISSAGSLALRFGTNPYTATFGLDNAGPGTAGFTPTGPLGFNPNTTALADMNQGNGTWTLALYDYYQDDLTTNFLENWEMNVAYIGQTTAIFAPATGLFTDAAGTIAYTGLSVNTVYANPTATTTYTATVNTAVCGSGTVSIPVNVGSPLSGTSTVANVRACLGANVTFNSTAPTGGLNATFQWQISTDAGVTWTNIAGATAANYAISGVTAAMNGNRFRVIRTVASCNSTLTSGPGSLTVSPLPVLVLSANPLTAIYPGQTTTLTVASSTSVPANGYTWFRDGVVVAGATGNTLVVDVDGLGVYTVAVNDVNSCSSTSASITIKDAPNDILFIYPSPNTGQFQVRYFSGSGNNPLPRVLNVYDNKGTRVFTKTYTVNVPYTRLEVDLGNHGKGIYNVELSDGNGRRLKTGRVIIL